MHRWRHVCTVPCFPSKQTSPPCHLPIFLTQILLTPAIHTSHCPHLLLWLIPWRWSLLLSFPAFLTPSKSPPLTPTPLLALFPTALGLFPCPEERVQILLPGSVSQQQLLGWSRLGYHHQENQVTTCHITCLKRFSSDVRGKYLRKNVYHVVR